MKKAIFVLVLLIFGLTASSLADLEFIAEITDCEGIARFRATGSPQEPMQPVVVGTRLQEGDEIFTGENAFVTLAIHNVVIRINPSTHFIIKDVTKSGNTLELRGELLLGEIWSKTMDAIDNLLHYEVITPTAVAGVEGTNFSVTYVGEITEVLVAEGFVAVRTRDGDPQLVLKSGEGAKITAKEILSFELADENEEQTARMKQWGYEREKDFGEKTQAGQSPEDIGESHQGEAEKQEPKGQPGKMQGKGGSK